jgi:hypothetical protein
MKPSLSVSKPMIMLGAGPASAETRRRYGIWSSVISIILLIPCFWHTRIEAGDLGSHVYNAWLAQLIQRGQAPGLWLAQQRNNVLFDLLLGDFGSLFGLGIAEKLAVSVAVLTFFWGSFAFVSAASGRPSWFLAPALAMFTYGWTFHAGFFNYYLSLGLAFLGVAILWRGGTRARLSLIVLVPFIWLAHPLGLAWFLGAGLYIIIAESLPRRLWLILPMVSGLFLLMVHYYIKHKYHTHGPHRPLYIINGADQLILFGMRYWFLAAVVFTFVVGCLLFDAIGRWREPGYLSHFSVPLQLYVLVEVAVILLPSTISLARYSVPVSLLVERLSLVSAVLAFAFLGCIRPRKWHPVGFGACAILFFSFLYQDTMNLNRTEGRVEQLVSTLPYGQRVMETILLPPGSEIYFIEHIVDRACVGRCFSYGNYEPSSGQFRVRAQPGNEIVNASPVDVAAMAEGTYIVKPEDLPAYQIYQCSSDSSGLCISGLQVGERNDARGVHVGGVNE